MTGFIRNDGGHVLVGTGQQAPLSSAVDKYGRAGKKKKVIILMSNRGENARRVPSSSCRVGKHWGASNSGDYTKVIVGSHAAQRADREKEETVDVRQIPGTEFSVATKKTVSQGSRIFPIDSSRRV